MDTARAIQIAVVQADMFICRARASPLPWIVALALILWAIHTIKRRC